MPPSLKPCSFYCVIIHLHVSLFSASKITYEQDTPAILQNYFSLLRTEVHIWYRMCNWKPNVLQFDSGTCKSILLKHKRFALCQTKPASSCRTQKLIYKCKQGHRIFLSLSLNFPHFLCLTWGGRTSSDTSFTSCNSARIFIYTCWYPSLQFPCLTLNKVKSHVAPIKVLIELRWPIPRNFRPGIFR